MKMDTPSENSISWGGIIFVALARNVLVLRFRSAIGIPIHSKLTVLFLSKRTGILKKQMHEKLFLIGYVNLYNKLV